MNRSIQFFILCNPILKPERSSQHEEYRRWLNAKNDHEIYQIYCKALPPRFQDPFVMFLLENGQSDDPH
jgi:hypothetical protein